MNVSADADVAGKRHPLERLGYARAATNACEHPLRVMPACSRVRLITDAPEVE